MANGALRLLNRATGWIGQGVMMAPAREVEADVKDKGQQKDSRAQDIYEAMILNRWC